MNYGSDIMFFAFVARFKKKEDVMVLHKETQKPNHQSKIRTKENGSDPGKLYAKVMSGDGTSKPMPEVPQKKMLIADREFTWMIDVQSTILVEVRDASSIPNLLYFML